MTVEIIKSLFVQCNDFLKLFPAQVDALPPLSLKEKFSSSLKLYHPLLSGLHEIVLTCDLEVRQKALTYLFETLKEVGKPFTPVDWSFVMRTIVFPIFEHIKTPTIGNPEEIEVWLSTTLIQALR
jgi:hypothetical protein